MNIPYTLYNSIHKEKCIDNNICNNEIKVKCPMYETRPISDRTTHHYKHSTLLQPDKQPFTSNTTNNQWQTSSTTNYGCKPYNCPPSILLIKNNNIAYQGKPYGSPSGANRYVSKYHYRDNKNGYATKYDLLKTRSIDNSWSSQLLNKNCKYTN